jgi:hypothetical protein
VSLSLRKRFRISISVQQRRSLVIVLDANGEECVIVHPVEWRDGKETALGNTCLMLNYNLEFQSSGWPAIRKIRLKDVHWALHVIERKRSEGPLPQRTTTARDCKEQVVSVVKPRRAWAEMFYWWAKDEVEPWRDEMLEAAQASSNLMSTDKEDSY